MRAQNDWSSLQLYARAADGEDTRPPGSGPTWDWLRSASLTSASSTGGRRSPNRCGSASGHSPRRPMRCGCSLLWASGSGKVFGGAAGLLASLLRAPWLALPIRLAVLRPGERPIDSLAKSLLPLRAADAQSDLTTLLRDLAGRAVSLASSLPEIQTSPLVVFVDQFEELYTLCKDDAERDAFVGCSCTRPRIPVVKSVVLTLRTDFSGRRSGIPS